MRRRRSHRSADVAVINDPILANRMGRPDLASALSVPGLAVGIQSFGQAVTGQPSTGPWQLGQGTATAGGTAGITQGHEGRLAAALLGLLVIGLAAFYVATRRFQA